MILHVFFLQVDSDNDSPDYKEQFIESGIFEEEEMDLKMEVEKELEMKRMITTKIANNNDNQARARSTRARKACALRALGLLLADGTPTVGGGKTF